jgi:hypothetical protein
MTCAEVEAQIELYAAGECTAPTAGAVADHLARCPACAAAEEQARRLVGLLDLHARLPAGLARLQARLQAEARPRRARLLPFVRPLRSLAALLLVTLGLGVLLTPGWHTPGGALGGKVELVLALVPKPIDAPEPFPGALVRAAPKVLAAKEPPLRYRLDLGGKSPADFRRHLEAGPLPLPPALGLALRLRNDSAEPLRLTVGGSAFACVLLLRGPGVVRVSVPHPAVRPFAVERTVTLAPGGSFDLPLERLAERVGQRVSYLYWTKPGDYTLRAIVRAPARVGSAGSPAQLLTLTSAPLTLHVEPKR